MIKSSPAGRAAFELFLISLLTLYFELLVIRWLSSEVRIFAYFKNVPLMASLFGLGVGLALANSKRDWHKWFPAGLLILSLLISFAEPLRLVHVVFINPVEHYLIGEFTEPFYAPYSFIQKAMVVVWGLFILVGIFYLIVFTFLCMGQRLGQLFDQFPPLVAYSINVGASLIGIALFWVVSVLSLKPDAWLLVGIVPALWFYHRPLQALALAAGTAAAFFTAAPNVFWSPYYRVSVVDGYLPADDGGEPFHYGYTINVNHDTIEGAYDNRPETLARLSANQKKEVLDYYDLLFEAIGDKPRTALILASGAGNDLAAALRHGVTDIDAVEIDPVIVQLGKELHPERPYDSPAVHVTVDDARAFLRRSNKKYDLVDFAYLDSHSAFSSMSSIRLDNYIYTVESFRDAARLLKDDGILAVTFYSLTAWQESRIYKTIAEALGEEPIGIWAPSKKAVTFLAGPGVDRQRIAASGFKLWDKEDAKKRSAIELVSFDQIDSTTDDWPFLFLRAREMTITYAAGLIFTLCVGWRLVGRAFGGFTASSLGRTMFCLGAAFMLIEVKSVSQMGLLLGTTWLVNSAVIGGILVMILLATLAQIRLKFKNPAVLYLLLFASLLGGYLTPLGALNSLPLTERVVLGTALLSLPILFASWIFAISFARVKASQAHQALGMNLLGTLIGGALEYLSMIFGIAALNLVALLLYGLAFLTWRQTEQKAAEHAVLEDTPLLPAPESLGPGEATIT